MRFTALCVKNLRAVRHFEIDDLGDFVVIAGPNGCGKSCVFDAIRLLKSVYGGYQADEHMQWFGELGIVVQDQSARRRMFRDPSQPMEIRATLRFAESEKLFMRAEIDQLIAPLAWQLVTGQRTDHWSFNYMNVATQLAQYEERVKPVAEAMKLQLSTELAADSFVLSLIINLDGSIHLTPCLPAQVSFQAFEPEHLGIIEYHSASRTYTRQPLQGINLDSRAFEDQRRQQSLYNWQAKYQNVKSELAAGYLRALIREKATESEGAEEDINDTLKELFRTFFPDKTYEGVVAMARGTLEFPVRLPGGETHDIDDLSSGEKEILYGYLRLRNSTPRNSVILLDEPELHLNPSLLQGFADFYFRHLGLAQSNQLWLVTHSDTLLRQAVGNSNYRVYHMLTATSATSGNQASEVLLQDDIERVTIDLVGDLAAYQPHAKVVILEGKSEDAFDEALIRRLFPDFAKRVNLISGGAKKRVRDLYAVLAESIEKVGIRNRFFAIVDKDADSYTAAADASQEFTWDVYHIENYLLVPLAVREAANVVAGSDRFKSDTEILSLLKASAEAQIDTLVLQRVQAAVNQAIVGSITVGGSIATGNVEDALLPSIVASGARVTEAFAKFTRAELAGLAESQRALFRSALTSDDWLKEFPGREILRHFSHVNLGSVNYETFRNIVLDRLALQEYRPEGIKRVLETIIAS